MKRYSYYWIVCILLFVIGGGLTTVWAEQCIIPDDGSGMVTVPPVCPYYNQQETILVTEGLPPSGFLEMVPTLRDMVPIAVDPVPGGQIIAFEGTLRLDIIGRGELFGYQRDVNFPVSGILFATEQLPGQPVQHVELMIQDLSGELLGDPDFCQFRIQAGERAGLPGNGTLVATQLPDGQFQVDSFFDITYEIDFEGCPGGKFDGMVASAVGRVNLSTNDPDDPHVILPGLDCWITTPGEIVFGGDVPPIPADFFGPGSEPFDGPIRFEGNPFDPESSPADTIVKRLTEAELFGPTPVPIEIVELNLKSVEPLRVSSFDGVDSFFDVFVHVDPSMSSSGVMEITQTSPDGGMYTFNAQANLVFEFIPLGPGSPVVFQASLPIMSIDSFPWVKEPDKFVLPCMDNNFYPAPDPVMPILGPDGIILKWHPPMELNKNFKINCMTDWQRALDLGKIQPLTQTQWDRYMEQWMEFPHEGEMYPVDTKFLPPHLYVAEDSDPDNNGDSACDEEGLVMQWGDDMPDNGDYASAFIYEYSVDPDLSNSTITVTVSPPAGCNINAVSFAMVDQNGLIRSWWWSVPGAIPHAPPGPPTMVTINTAMTGLGATNPPATGYVNNPGFDITKVLSFTVDENSQWIFGQQPVPAPGQTVPVGVWNYWHNLTVTPNLPGGPAQGVNSKWYNKWSQPPVVQDDGMILGWDEPSNDRFPPLLADDWQCADNRPITDIHWWGSFLGWTQPFPPKLPDAFHIGIWTDVPAGVDQPYSHPGKMIWENICKEYAWNFAGYDHDPRGEMHDEACFQFAQLLSEDEWFIQEPMEDGQPNVYWLSIAAIWNDDEIPHPWGWKTRPHFFNDDAVRIWQVVNPDGTVTWPPKPGAIYQQGDPILFPADVSWDLAFELTTNEPGYEDNPIPGDINLDRAVNLDDFVIMAANWMASAP